jgi:1-acyl-sn-glycerol-3-phosphate acyltransferase
MVSMMVLGLFALLCSLFMDPKWIGRLFGTTWSRLIIFLTPVFVTVEYKCRLPTKQSYVIVANHLSFYDIFIIYGWLRRDIKWVMKQELGKVPGLNFGSRAIGHIFIDRSSAKAALKSIEEAKSVLKDGISVVFFPEGSRSTSGTIEKFKKGAFKTAMEINLPILPVTIRGTNRIMPPGTFNIFPGKAKIIVHEPVELDNYSSENVNELTEKVRDIIISAF